MTGLVVVPLAATALAGRLGAMLSRLPLDLEGRRRLGRRFACALIPLGFAMWLAHYVFHLATAGGSWAAVAARFGGAGVAAGSLLDPDTLLSLEILALGVGLQVTLFVAWRIALDAGRSWRPAEYV